VSDNPTRRLVDARRVVKYQSEIGVLAVLWYHALTTGAGVQTLGEEYCDIHQVNARGGACTR
jgi:peroxin-10